MSDMDELITWLRAQLDDDEAVIVRNRGDKGLSDDASYPDYQTYDGPDIDAACDYLQQFPPPRMLVEVEAKRRILAMHAASCEQVRNPVDSLAYGEARRAQFELEEVIRMLAQPYAGREGWRAEWALSEPA